MSFGNLESGNTFSFVPQTGDNHDKSKRNKRKRANTQRQCQQCFTSETPEWRRGPNGPRT